MQKIRCPQCGVINLEKFISYPQCAGCGSTLPHPQQVSPVVSFWQRPVKPIVWVSVVGAALAGLIWAASVFQIKPENESQVVVYGNTSRSGVVGQVIALNLRVDALGESRIQRTQPLRNVQLRLPLRIFKTLRFVSISPAPDEMKIIGSGRYFEYRALERETSIRLDLRVMHEGDIRLPIAIYADNHAPGDWRIKVALRGVEK
jgi:hypothetical protein